MSLPPSTDAPSPTAPSFFINHVHNYPTKYQHTLCNSQPTNFLSYRHKRLNFFCSASGKFFSKGFFYGCDNCSYNLEIRCATRWRNISATIKCNEHALFPIRNPIQFTCEVCGGKSNEIACLCSSCRLLIHSTCAQFLGTIKIRRHDHSLTCTFSLGQVKKH
jgi:hypothetical protein